MTDRAYDVITTRLNAMRPGYTTVIEGVAVTRETANRFEVGMITTVEALDFADAAIEICERSEAASARLVWAAMLHSVRPTIARKSLAPHITGLAAVAGRQTTITHQEPRRRRVFAGQVGLIRPAGAL